MSQNFYPGDLRLDQFRDLSIKSQWGNMKMLPASYKPSVTTQFFQDHGHSLICDDPGAPDDWGSRGGHLRSNEVTIRLCQ